MSGDSVASNTATGINSHRGVAAYSYAMSVCPPRHLQLDAVRQLGAR